MAKLQLAWMNGIDVLKDAWDIFVFGNEMAFQALTDFISDVWNGAVNGIAKGITWIMEKLGVAAEGAVQELGRMQAAEAKARQRERNAREDPMQNGQSNHGARRRKETLSRRRFGISNRRLPQRRKVRRFDRTKPQRARADLDRAVKASQEFAKSEPTAAKKLGSQVAMGNQSTGKITSLGTFSGVSASQALGIKQST